MNSTFHLMRNFIALLRAFGYQRFISIENFRKPNFPLMADILVFLLKRFDLNTDVEAKISNEQERLSFVQTTSQIMVNRANLDVNMKKLYLADINAVHEMIKLAKLIQNAWILLDRSKVFNDQEDIEESEISSLDNIDRSVFNSYKTSQITSDILQIGTQLYDTLAEHEPNKEHRQQSLNRQLMIDEIESTIRRSIQNLQQEIVDLQNKKENIDQDDEDLEAKIEKKHSELVRNRKRSENLNAQRPAYMDELEKVEEEIADYYEQYVVKSRCLGFLEQKLEEFEELERIKINQRNEEIKLMLENMKMEDFMKDGDNLRLNSSWKTGNQTTNDDMALIVDIDEDEIDGYNGSDFSDKETNDDSKDIDRQKMNSRKLRSEKKERSLMTNTVVVNNQRSGVGNKKSTFDSSNKEPAKENVRSAKTAKIYSFGSLLENDDDSKSDLNDKASDSELDLEAIDDTDNDDDDSISSTYLNLDSSRKNKVTNNHLMNSQQNSIIDTANRLSQLNNYDKGGDDF